MRVRSIHLLCFMKTRTSAISNSQRWSGPQSSLSLVGLRSSGMWQPRCPQSTSLCYHIPMQSFVVFKSIFVNPFVIYHLALICASSTDFLLLIKSWLSIIIDLTNPPSIFGLHICLCHCQSCFSLYPNSFWPKDHLRGLEVLRLQEALIVRLVLSWTEVASEQTSRESLVLLETTQSLLVREEVTLGSFQERWIENQVKLKAWLSKYWLFIYRQGRARAMKLKVGTSGKELSICRVRSGAQTCCGLYEANNRGLA